MEYLFLQQTQQTFMRIFIYLFSQLDLKCNALINYYNRVIMLENKGQYSHILYCTNYTVPTRLIVHAVRRLLSQF